jgi:hypothetical protein
MKGGVMMNIEIRSADTAVISGYVNAVERESRVLRRVGGQPFREIVRQGTFKKALSGGKTVQLMLDHERTICDTKSGLELREDNIGLFAKAVISDKEVISAAKSGKLTGWSFGFRCMKDSWNDTGELRTLEEIELDEVSILTKTPAYTATSIELRDGDILRECRFESELTVEKPAESVPDSRFEMQKKKFEILKMKGKCHND